MIAHGDGHDSDGDDNNNEKKKKKKQKNASDFIIFAIQPN